MLAAMANVTTSLAYRIYNIQKASPIDKTQVSNPQLWRANIPQKNTEIKAFPMQCGKWTCIAMC